MSAPAKGSFTLSQQDTYDLAKAAILSSNNFAGLKKLIKAADKGNEKEIKEQLFDCFFTKSDAEFLINHLKS